MKKVFFATAMLAGALVMASCNNNNEPQTADTGTLEEVVVSDTVKYLGYPHGEEMPVEFCVVDDHLVKATANGEEMPVLEHKQAMVVYGEAEPTAVADSLAKTYKHVKTIQTSSIDRMNRGEKNNAWIVLYTNEECQHNCCKNK